MSERKTIALRVNQNSMNIKNYVLKDNNYNSNHIITEDSNE